MSFSVKTWVDRAVTYAGRRKLTNVDTEESATYDVERDEGEVLAEGDAFNAENMNDLEERISAAVEKTISVDTVGTAVGADNIPIYINESGVATASTKSLGGSSTPIYMSSGTLTEGVACLPLSGGTMTGAMTNTKGYYGSLYGGSYSAINIQCTHDVRSVNVGSSSYMPMYASDFSTSSSRLTKTNIEDMEEKEAKKILDVDVVTFDYKECFGGKTDQRGVIAEDVIDIIPSVVSVPDNYSENNFDESLGISNDVLGIDYSKFVPYLIKMVQIQQKQIEDLQDQVNQPQGA